MRLKKFADSLRVFALGGMLYPSLEIFWRERTHWSMALLGGTCLFGLYRIHLRLARAPRLVKCVLGGMLITAAELAAGFTFNRKRTIWDYSRVPLNYKGQICLPFSVLWSLLCLPAGTLCDSLSLCAGTRSGGRNRVQS
mgnify:CR=1 FL=1